MADEISPQFKAAFDDYVLEYKAPDSVSLKPSPQNTLRYQEMLQHASKDEIQKEAAARLSDRSQIKYWGILLPMWHYGRPGIALEWLRDHMKDVVESKDSRLIDEAGFVLSTGVEADTQEFRELARALEPNMRAAVLSVVRRVEYSLASQSKLDPNKLRKIASMAPASEEDKWEADHPDLVWKPESKNIAQAASEASEGTLSENGNTVFIFVAIVALTFGGLLVWKRRRNA